MNKDDFAQYFGQITASLPFLISLVPADKLEWTPPGGKFMPLGALIQHLAQGPAIISTAVKDQFPDAETFKKLIAENDTRRSTPAEAQTLFNKNREQAQADLAALTEENYRHLEVTAPFGTMKMWRMLMAGAEHLLNHKMQLFIYLKMLGQPVTWANLMRGK